MWAGVGAAAVCGSSAVPASTAATCDAAAVMAVACADGVPRGRVALLGLKHVRVAQGEQLLHGHLDHRTPDAERLSGDVRPRLLRHEAGQRWYPRVHVQPDGQSEQQLLYQLHLRDVDEGRVPRDVRRLPKVPAAVAAADSASADLASSPSSGTTAACDSSSNVPVHLRLQHRLELRVDQRRQAQPVLAQPCRHAQH
jgi:hypothetical protein